MKKIMLIAFSILTMMALATPCTVSAVTTAWATGVFDFAPTEGSLTYGLSNNVYLDYSVAADEQDYAIATVHQAGNRGYTTTNNTTLIYFCTKSTGATTAGVTLPTEGDTSAQIDTGIWSAM
jgi:hypothetical protein